MRTEVANDKSALAEVPKDKDPILFWLEKASKKPQHKDDEAKRDAAKKRMQDWDAAKKRDEEALRNRSEEAHHGWDTFADEDQPRTDPVPNRHGRWNHGKR